MNKTFSFFAPAYILEKSGKNSPGIDNPVKVGGIITTTDKDIDGERISKSSDFTYFENGFGKIKFEHQDYKEPYSFIGSPLKIIRKGKETHFIGELYPFDPNADKQKTPQRELAKAAYGLLLEIEEHNKRHPNNLQKAGWSIEGDYLEKDKKTGLVKARIVNVVLTTKPRNMQTFAQLVKSLEVGYGMTPSTQTGFGATAVSSLQGDKNLATKIKKGANKMPQSKKEVYDNLIGEGKTHDEALKAANEFETQKENTISENFVKAEKSLGSAKEKLTKSIETASSVLDIDVDLEVETHKNSLAKSLKTEIDEEFDAGKFLIEQAKVLTKSLEAIDAITQKVDLLAKSIVTNAEAEVERLDNAEFVQNIVSDSRSEVIELKKSLALFAQKLAKSTGMVTFTESAINNAKVEDNNKQVDDKPLTKSVILDTLDKLAEEGKVEKSLVSRFESNMGLFAPDFILEKHEMDLVKSKVAELKK